MFHVKHSTIAIPASPGPKPERAGRAAAWRALENAVAEVKQGRQVRFLFLPDGHDPDTLVREEGAEAFEARLATALPLSDYLIRELSARSDPSSVDGRARLVELARPLIRRIPKRGFNNARHRVEYLAVNLEALSGFAADAVVDHAALRSAGIARGKAGQKIKILGDGALDRRLVVHAHAFSGSAKEKIEKAGGKVEVIAPPAAAATEG